MADTENKTAGAAEGASNFIHNIIDQDLQSHKETECIPGFLRNQTDTFTSGMRNPYA